MIIEVMPPENLDFITTLKDEEGKAIYGQFSEAITSKLERLYEINISFNDIDRMLGPAIFLDILKYLYHRMSLVGNEYIDQDGKTISCFDDQKKYNYINKIFSEAVIAYVVPQFEGLGSNQRSKVIDFFDYVFDGEDSSSVKDKLK